MKTQTYHAEQAEGLLAAAGALCDEIESGERTAIERKVMQTAHDRFVSRAHVHALLATVGRLAP